MNIEFVGIWLLYEYVKEFMEVVCLFDVINVFVKMG